MCFQSDHTYICRHLVCCDYLDAEVGADACFYLHGNCRKTVFSQRCLSRYVNKSNCSIVLHILTY